VREVRLDLKPVSRGLGEHGRGSRYGARANRREYWKREDVSARAFSAEEIQTAEKENWRQAASMYIILRRCIVPWERDVRVVKDWTMAWLSQ
jgi:hypothetical protein